MNTRLIFALLSVLITLLLPAPARAQVYEKVFDFTAARIVDFANTPNKGSLPSGLVQGSDGHFYGTTSSGGAESDGTVFKLSPDGVFTTLVEFTDNGASNKGKSPRGMVQAPDGNFYGTTFQGGANGDGTVFRMTLAGVLTTLVEFTGNGPTNKGDLPGTMVRGSDGNFYGTTSEGGANNFGTVFKMTPAGVLTTLVQFTGNGASNKGSDPEDLVEGSDGNFYGTTQKGGASDCGTVFKMTPAGVLTTLVQFTGDGASNKGRSPNTLVAGTDGNFYGTTEFGATGYTGSNFTGHGTVFKVTPAGVLTTLVLFTDNGASNKGRFPNSLVLGRDGVFYGITGDGAANGFGTAFKVTAAGALTTLVQFTDEEGGGLRFQGSDGNFYGIKGFGGANDAGLVFKMTAAGMVTTVVEFSGFGTSETGRSPRGLCRGTDGNFYGTTFNGGGNNDGTVFRITTGGALTTLVEFAADGSLNKGENPESGLVQSSDGSFYGTTSRGGANSFGTVFKVTPAGVLTTLVEFTGNVAPNKGRLPFGGLIQGSDGNFYGTTIVGGGSGTELGNGTVFKMTPAGALTTLVQFTDNGSSNKGLNPQGSLVQGTDGNFYGTTGSGGADSAGTVFRMTPAGVLTTLVQFTGNGSSNKGAFPLASLVQSTDGNFYGTTSGGGASDAGTVFRMTPAGVLTTLVQFTDNAASNKGRFPQAPLLRGSDGNFYGTTSGGGANDAGTIFRTTSAGVLTTLLEFVREEEGNPLAGLVAAADGNLYGTTTGGDGSVYRLVFSGAPTAAVTRVGSEGTGGAVVEAQVNPRGASTTVVLEYGTDGVTFPPANNITIVTGLTGMQTRLVGTTVTGLATATAYYFRFRATSSAGTTVTPVQSFSTLAEPVANAAAASAILPTSARFNGTVNARSFSTSVVFEWGTDGNSFPNVAAATPGIVTGSTDVPVSADVAGLQVGATYFYRIKATNVAGTTVSGARSFITLIAPLPTLGAASGVAANSVQVAGTVNARGTSTAAVFDYGTDGVNFPNSVAAVPATITGTSATAVAATLSGLTQGTTYFFRLRATSAGGVAQTTAASFATLALPVVATQAANGVGQTFATLNGTVNALGLTTSVVFDYGIDAGSLSNTVAALPGSATGSSVTAVSRGLAGLTLDTVYFFRVRATSSAGTSAGEVQSFRTGQSAISVQTGAASEISSTSARLAGTVNAQGLATTVAFEVGTAADLSDAVGFASTPQTVSEAAAVPVSARLSGLNEGVRYFYRLTATNVEGTTVGSILDFVSEANVLPIAAPDVIFYAGQVVVDPLENDTDANNTPPVPANEGLLLDPTLVTPPNASLGVASVTGDRRFISYNPQFNVRDDDALTYRVVDPLGASAEAQVRLIAFSKRAGLYGGRIVAGTRELSVALQMGSGGAISTSFMDWSDESFVLKGVFDQHGTLTRTLNSPGGAVLTITLTLDADLPQIRGSFEERVGGMVTASAPSFVLTKDAGTGGLAESGLRTGFLSPPSAQAAVMADGFLRMTVGKDSRRGARFAGRLPDGEPFLASARAQGRSYDLTKALEQGGVFTGLVRAIDTSAGAGGMMGNLAWRKRASSRARYHRSGVETVLSLAGVAYPVVARGELPPIGLGVASPNARLRLSGGDFVGTYRDLLLNIVPGSVQIIGPDAAQSGADISLNKLQVKVDGAKAVFSGRFLHPETGKLVPFSGGFRVPFDTQPGQGRGVFRGPGAAGAVRIEAE